MSTRSLVIAVAMIILTLVVGCGGTKSTSTATPEPTATIEPTATLEPTATIEPTATLEPTTTTDPELEAFAAELTSINSRLREGIQAALTAPEEKDYKASLTTLVEINSDAQNLNVPEDNEAAQELLPYLLDCTDSFREDMTIDRFLQANQDCLLYFELFEKLLETGSSGGE